MGCKRALPWIECEGHLPPRDRPAARGEETCVSLVRNTPTDRPCFPKRHMRGRGCCKLAVASAPHFFTSYTCTCMLHVCCINGSFVLSACCSGWLTSDVASFQCVRPKISKALMVIKYSESKMVGHIKYFNNKVQLHGDTTPTRQKC